MSTKERGHGRCTPPEGDVLKLNLLSQGNHLHGKVRSRAGTGGSIGQLGWVLASVLNEILEFLEGTVRLHYTPLPLQPQPDNGGKIFHGIIFYIDPLRSP